MSQVVTPAQFPSQKESETLPSYGSSEVSDFIQETLAMTKRLFIQLQRRPSSLVAGIIQPFM